MLDNIKALQFINRNIAAFGGNAGNVTVMGQSAGAIDVYALLTSPLMVAANPKLFHKVLPISGGLSLASNLPPGSFATLNTRAVAQAQGSALLNNLVIGDGLAADNATATAYVATQTPAQIAAYLRAKTPATLLTTLLTKLALRSASPARARSPKASWFRSTRSPPSTPATTSRCRCSASNTRDEAKLFPTFLALAPVLGGVSGRLVSDATLFSTQFSYNPNAAPTITIGQWIPAQYLPVTTPVTGFNAETDLLNTIFFIASRNNILNALKAQQPGVWYYQFNWDEEPAPWNDIYGAAHAFDLPFVFGNFGPSLFSNVMNRTANQPGRLDLSDAMMKSVGAFAQERRPEQRLARRYLAGLAGKLIFDATPTAKAITVQ